MWHRAAYVSLPVSQGEDLLRSDTDLNFVGFLRHFAVLRYPGLYLKCTRDGQFPAIMHQHAPVHQARPPGEGHDCRRVSSPGVACPIMLLSFMFRSVEFLLGSGQPQTCRARVLRPNGLAVPVGAVGCGWGFQICQ